VFDVGANFGWYSLNMARKFPESMIYSFEPVLKTFNYLVDNVKLNDFKNIYIYNFGFSNEESEAVLYYYPTGSVNASLSNLTDLSEVEEKKCLVKKMDNFIAETKTRVDFIKCDVEGAELLVFQGGIDSIKEYKPIIFSEILRKWSKKFNYQPDDIIKLLSGVGYICFVSDGVKLRKINAIDDNTMETNFFFLHPEKHLDEIMMLT
jgi:FkbM family methyltransferase